MNKIKILCNTCTSEERELFNDDTIEIEFVPETEIIKHPNFNLDIRGRRCIKCGHQITVIYEM